MKDGEPASVLSGRAFSVGANCSYFLARGVQVAEQVTWATGGKGGVPGILSTALTVPDQWGCTLRNAACKPAREKDN